MSQSYYYSDNHPQQYYPPTSYETAQAPVHTQSPTYHGYYPEQVITPSAHAVDDSSVLTQSYTYSEVNYAPDATANQYSSYVSVPNHAVPNYPDSENHIPHQGVPQVAPAENWAEPARYTEAATQPSDVYEQRRGSCASSTSVWYPQDQANTGYYDQQPVSVDHYTSQQSHAFQQQQPESMNFGMYSPNQYLRTQSLARHAPVEHPEVVPYGTLPIHEPEVHPEQRPSAAYQTFDNGSTHATQFSPFVQSYPQPNQSPSPSSTADDNSDSTATRKRGDLYVQQRFAADYQHELQAQQELKYHLSGQLEQLEASVMNNQTHTQHQQHHQHQHQHQHQAHHCQGSSNHALPLSTPVVPSQAHERIPTRVHTTPKVEEKKEPSKKPALACLFCRKRKIACGPPSPDNPDRTCNQCARRRQSCEYPAESRRGIRKAKKEPALEEPTVHKFVSGDADSNGASSKGGPGSKGGVGPIRRVRRKRG